MRRCLQVFGREKLGPAGHLPPGQAGCCYSVPRQCLNRGLSSSSYPRVSENGEEIAYVKGGCIVLAAGLCASADLR